MKRHLSNPAPVLVVLGVLSMLVVPGPPTQAGVRGPARGLEVETDELFRSAVRSMLAEARRFGVAIDTDIDILLTQHRDIFYAKVDGAEDVDLLVDARDGVEVGFLYLRGEPDVPDGYYLLRFFVDSRDLGSAHALLVDRRGAAFRRPLAIGNDPTPELGPRKELRSVDGGALATEYWYDSNWLCYIVDPPTT